MSGRGSLQSRWWAATLLLALVGRVAWAQEVGTIAELAGTAYVGRGGTWSPAAVSAAIRLGDEVRTDRPGRVRIVFQDDSVVTISDDSHLTIDQQIFDPARDTARSLMGLVRGKVSALVSEYYHHSGTAFEIKTTTAVAGVRGTDFVMTHDERGGVTEVVGISGQIEVRSAQDPSAPGVLVTAKELTTVAPGKLPRPPRRLDDSNFRQFIEGIDFVGAGRFESQTVDHPLLAGAAVPQPDRAGTLTASGAGPRGERGSLAHDPRDASSILHEPPAAVESATGRLRIGLF